MEASEIKALVQSQRKYFFSGVTLPIERRIHTLKALKETIIFNQSKIENALKSDLGKSSQESYMCEIGLVLNEISYMIKHLNKFAKPHKVKGGLSQFPSKAKVVSCPYGVTLIMSPWNYPFLLSFQPLVEAISAGNTAIVKPSAFSRETGLVVRDIINSVFPRDYVAVVLGGREENQYLLNQKFDYIFFTGSQQVGKEVMLQASKNLTPVTLELGGKSPCIVDSTANLKVAARRIVFGKFLNCGQTCVAPDYILCEASIKSKLISALKKEIVRQFTKKPLENDDYGKIINKRHFNRILRLIDQNKKIFGGKFDEVKLKIEPTILDNADLDDFAMQEEIFGPVLPIMTFDSIENVVSFLQNREKPLALYVFSSNKATIKTVMEQVPFGGGCVNDVISHLAVSGLPFGGIGESGMGCYHGKYGFETFSHKKSILDKKTYFDLSIRYQPYKEKNEKKIKKFLK